ncbi:MAG: AIR synthase-related protein [Cyanobacteria bacterium J06627_15]
MVGLIEDLSQTCGQGWRQAGDVIYLLGLPLGETGNGTVTLGGSDYLAAIHGQVAGKPPQIDVALELAVQAACRHGIRQGWVQSAHDLSEGGLAVALAEACISGGLGAEVELAKTSSRWDTLLFGEGGGRIVVSVSPAHAEIWQRFLDQTLPGRHQRLGTVGTASQPLQVTTQLSETPSATTLLQLSVSRLKDPWQFAIERALSQ